MKFDSENLDLKKRLLLCWSVSVPQSLGKATFDPVGEVKVIVSVLHKPAEFGCLKTNASKSSRTWQTAEIWYHYENKSV